MILMSSHNRVSTPYTKNLFASLFTPFPKSFFAPLLSLFTLLLAPSLALLLSVMLFHQAEAQTSPDTTEESVPTTEPAEQTTTSAPGVATKTGAPGAATTTSAPDATTEMDANNPTDEPLAQQLHDKLKSEALNVRIILQSTANYSITEDAFANPNQFGLGPAMVMLRGNLDKQFDYKFMVNFNRPSPVMDVTLGYRIQPNLKLNAGLQKPDMGLDLLPSPAETDFADRARMVSTMTNVRDIGVSLDGQFDAFDLNVGLYNGTGLTGTNDGNFMILAKAGYTFDISPAEQLYVGFNSTLNTTTSEPVGNTGYISDRDRLTYGFYAKWALDTWFGAAEFMQTRFDNVSLGNERDSITSFYATAGYHLTDTADLLVRWDHLSFDLESNRGSDLVILGWNQQLSSLMSFQTNLLADFRGDSDEFGLVGVFQFYFK